MFSFYILGKWKASSEYALPALLRRLTRGRGRRVVRCIDIILSNYTIYKLLTGHGWESEWLLWDSNKFNREGSGLLGTVAYKRWQLIHLSNRMVIEIFSRYIIAQCSLVFLFATTRKVIGIYIIGTSCVLSTHGFRNTYFNYCIRI